MRAASNRHLHCDTLADVAALRRLRDSLAAVAELPAAASSIVQHPDWLLFELESRGATTSPHIVVARNPDGLVVGYVPLLLRQDTVRIALGNRRVSIHHGRIFRLLGSGVVASAGEREAVEQAISTAISRDRAIGLIQIQETLLPNSLANALSAQPDGFAQVLVNLREQVNWTIQPPPSLPDYMDNLGTKRRQKLVSRCRHTYKKLGDEAHVRVFQAPEEIDEYCRLMNQVHARSWHAAELAIDWEAPLRRAFFHRLARSQQMVGYLLMLGTRPVAYEHTYRLGGNILLDSTGYDEAFASCGAGSTLIFQAIQALIERYPGESIDFGYGDNEYKRLLANQQSPCGSMYLVRGVGARVCFSLVVPLRGLYWLQQWARGKWRATRRTRRS